MSVRVRMKQVETKQLVVVHTRNGKTVQEENERNKTTTQHHHKFHFSYKLFGRAGSIEQSPCESVCVCVSMCGCVWVYVCACAEAKCAYVLVCADKLKIINNRVNEKEKEGEHRVAGTENHFVLVIFQF